MLVAFIVVMTLLTAVSGLLCVAVLELSERLSKLEHEHDAMAPRVPEWMRR